MSMTHSQLTRSAPGMGFLLAAIVALGQALIPAAHAASATALHVISTAPSAGAHAPTGAMKQRVSPYARAAAAKARAAQGSPLRASGLTQGGAGPHRTRGAGGAR